MYLNNVNNGTKMYATFEDGFEACCVLEGKIDHISFYANCSDVFARIDEFKGQIPSIKFYVGDKHYTFNGEILGKSQTKYAMVDTFDIRIKTPFKEGTDRTEFRFETNMRVRIYSYSDDVQKRHAGDWICDAQSCDISKKGIKLWADHKLTEPKDTLFTLEFKLTRDDSYLVPARIVRNQRNASTLAFNYDYGFLFDFSNEPEKGEKLLMDLLYAKINHII